MHRNLAGGPLVRDCILVGRANGLQQFANLISKLNFYKLIPYPMDNC